MNQTFHEVNELSQIMTKRMENSSSFLWNAIPLTGRVNHASEYLERLWTALQERGWTRVTKLHFSDRNPRSNGWCRSSTGEVFVKQALTKGKQLEVLVHEAVHAIEADRFNLYNVMNDPNLGGYWGAEVRAETVTAMVMREFSDLQPMVQHASDYVALQNRIRPMFTEYLFPERFDRLIFEEAEEIYGILTGS